MESLRPLYAWLLLATINGHLKNDRIDVSELVANSKSGSKRRLMRSFKLLSPTDAFTLCWFDIELN